MTKTRLVHLVDDEEAIRRSAAFMLRTSGLRVKTYESGLEFVKASTALERGCVLLDIRMPGVDGLEVQEALKQRGVLLPVVIMTGHGDVALAVHAMKAGAVDFIEKPFEKQVLLDALHQGFELLERRTFGNERASEASIRLQALTQREREVLDGLSQGLPNKTIAYELGISPRTVEIHRANVMAKLSVKSLSEALRIAFAAQDAPAA